MRLDIDLSEHPAAGLRHNALRQDLSGAFDGVASAIPIALCGVALVYVNFPASFFLSNGVFATLLALAAMLRLAAERTHGSRWFLAGVAHASRTAMNKSVRSSSLR